MTGMNVQHRDALILLMGKAARRAGGTGGVIARAG